MAYNLASLGKDLQDENYEGAYLDGLGLLGSLGGLAPVDELEGILALILTVETTAADAYCSAKTCGPVVSQTNPPSTAGTSDGFEYQY